MTTLFGEWHGELGFLVSLYAPALRARSRHFDRTVVALDASLAYLVEDFADEVVPIRCQGHAQHTGKVLEGGDRVAAMLAKAKDSDTVMLGDWVVRNRKTVPVEFFKYGADALDFAEFDVVVFLRPPKPLSGGRGDPLRKSWPAPGPKMAIAMLAESGLSVACAGGPDNLHHEPAADLRGVGLKFLCGTLHRAKAILGPSSGPLHLAAMTGAPIVTWCSHVDGPSIRRRYELAPPLGWNPFGSRAIYMGNSNPTPEAVAEAVKGVCG